MCTSTAEYLIQKTAQFALLLLAFTTAICPLCVTDLILDRTSDHVQVFKFLYSVVIKTVTNLMLLLAPLGFHPVVPCSFLDTAVMASAGQSSHHHHEFTEVDLGVSVKIQTFQQLVHLFLVLRCLYIPTKSISVAGYCYNTVSC